MPNVPNKIPPEIDHQLLEEKDALIFRQQQQINALKELLKEEISNKQSFARSLRLQMSKNEELINAVPWIVLLVSKDLLYSDVNRYFAHLFELTPEDFIDKRVGSLGENECLVSIIDWFNSQQNAPTARQELHLEINGIDRYYLLTLFKNTMSEQISVIGINNTKRVIAEKELIATKEQVEQSARDLEKSFNETSRLMEEALAANQAKSEFLATVSHEL